MRCRYSRRKCAQERWKVYLYWQGRKWTRYRYDDRVPLSSEFLASRLAAAINNEIERLGPGFSPKSWFSPSAHELRMENYARAWLERRARDLAPASYASFRSLIEKYIVPLLGNLDIRNIKLGHLEDYLLQLPREFLPKTKESHVALVRAILRDAFRREELQRVPPFPIVKVPEAEIKWLNVEQQAVVLKAIPQKHQPIFNFLAFYGCRPAEARALQWDCVDWVAKTITIKRSFSGLILRETTKTAALRVLPMMPEIEELLRPIRGLGGWVFRVEGGDPYGHARLTRIWKTAISEIGLPHIKLYQGVRHSCGMQKIHEDWDIEHIRELFGHASFRMTKRYAKADVRSLRSRFERGLSGHPRKKQEPE